MSKKSVAVLFGGCSNEYEVSLKSAASVIEQINLDKYNLIMIGITKEGNWLRYSGSIDEIKKDSWHQHPSCIPSFISPSREVKGLVELVHTEFHVVPVDVVFPVLHGKYGEDGTVQGLLELAGIPYVGCNSLSSAVAMDKVMAHTLVKAEEIKVTSSVVVFRGESATEAAVQAEKLGYPLYVKPVRSGSSIGITKAANKEELIAGIQAAFAHDNKVVIERNIAGFEIGCAVLGNLEPIVGIIDEIEVTDGFFNFTEKYTLQSSKIHLPARIDSDTAERARETALRIYKVLGCQGFARVDLFVTPEKEIVFNEVNTIPGFTSSSRYPNMLQKSGMNYSEIIDRLLNLALVEADEQWKL